MAEGEGRRLRVLSPTAILGYGFPTASLERGLAQRPDVIAVDAGSTDPGPYYLGAGQPFTSRAGVRRDLQRLLPAALARHIPLIVGSSGGSGAAPHLDWTVEIVRELAREQGLRFSAAIIPADIPKPAVRAGLVAGRVRPLPGAPELTGAALDATTRVVAQMGWEPIAAALERGADVILCGRAYDPAVFAAPALRHGFDPGLALHMGKILECAAIAATPGSGSDCVLGTLYRDHFVLETLSDERAFTCTSVAAHALYEKADPYRLEGPGGRVDLGAAAYEQLPGGRVRVSGARFEAVAPYTLKLEGARRVGFRAISVAGVRDPHFIAQADEILAAVRAECLAAHGGPARLFFHVYGRDGVMGAGEPRRDPAGREIGIVTEVVADDQESASALCAQVRSTLLHCGYPGRLSTGGNLALPFSPSDLAGGPVYEFSVYHLLEAADAAAWFPVQDVGIGP